MAQWLSEIKNSILLFLRIILIYFLIHLLFYFILWFYFIFYFIFIVYYLLYFIPRYLVFVWRAAEPPPSEGGCRARSRPGGRSRSQCPHFNWIKDITSFHKECKGWLRPHNNSNLRRRGSASLQYISLFWLRSWYIKILLYK